MPIMFRRIRGRAAGHVVTVNPLSVRCIEPTRSGGSELHFSDVHVLASRDSQAVVQELLEGRTRLCTTALCDRTTVDPYMPVCARCRDAQPRTKKLELVDGAGADLSNGGFR